MKRLRDEWLSFRASVVPEKASPLQVQECRRSFYAGAWAALQLVSAASGEMSETAAIFYLQGLHDECRAFNAEVVKGRR